MEKIKLLKSKEILDSYKKPDINITFHANDIEIEFNITVSYERLLHFDFNKVFDYWKSKKENIEAGRKDEIELPTGHRDINKRPTKYLISYTNETMSRTILNY